MPKEWALPERSSITPAGRDRFLHLLSNLQENERVRIMMLFWRIWYVRNEMVHSKQPPPVDVSVRFLASYLSCILSLRECPNVGGCQYDQGWNQQQVEICFH